jgi:hypothetical protein
MDQKLPMTNAEAGVVHKYRLLYKPLMSLINALHVKLPLSATHCLRQFAV